MNATLNAAWGVALRLAHREVWRAWGRSALVAAMIGVPVLLITAATVLFRTVDGAQSEQAMLLRKLGAADAQVVAAGRTPLLQDPLGRTTPAGGTGAADLTEPTEPGSTGTDGGWTEREVAEAVGGRVVAVREGGALIRTDTGALSARVRELDLGDPLTAGLATIAEGRVPQEPREVAVSEAVADKGFGPGTTVHFVDGGDRTVVGVVRNPVALKESELVGLPGSVLADDVEPTYLVDTAAPVDWSTVRELNGLGLAVISRAVLLDPPPDDQLPTELQGGNTSGLRSPDLMLPILVIGCVVLEVALLAGPAFAVGARRQRRTLALVVATGGTPTDVRRMVLAQAVVLGLGSAVLGAVLGIAAVAGASPLVDSRVGMDVGAPVVPPVRVLLIVAVGAFSAVAAAYLPAVHASRQDTVAVLAGRRGDVRFQRHRPLIGLLVAAAGLGLAVVGMRASSGGETPVVFGTLGLVVGAILLMPALLGAVGRLGAGLPLSLRLASRDVARHRSRTASTMSAIMGAVIGITALAIGSSSDFAQSRRDYVPREQPGSLTISFDDTFGPAGLQGAVVSDRDARALADAVEGLLPGHPVTVQYSGGGMAADGVYENVDVLLTDCVPTENDPCVWAWAQPGMAGYGLPMLVASPEETAEILGRPLTDEQRTVLDNGGVLVPDAATVEAADPATGAMGTARIRSGPWDRAETVDLPAAALPELVLREGDSIRLVAGLVGTRETAERLDLTVSAHRVVAAAAEPGISEERQDTVEELAKGFVPRARVYVERGFTGSYTPLWLILAGLGGLIVLAGTLTATALAMDDARPDLATLAAIGASPWVRRRQAMAQAALTGLLGALLGVAVGAVPGIAITWPLTAPSTGGHVVAIPWSLLGTVVVAVPLVAVAAAGLLTRSHLPMVARGGA